MAYETEYNGKIITFKDGNFIDIYVNGERWGSPQGDRFFRALLQDIEQLKKENDKLKVSNNKIAENWIDTLISYLELMDQHHPDWRLFAEKEIKQLKSLLN